MKTIAFTASPVKPGSKEIPGRILGVMVLASAGILSHAANPPPPRIIIENPQATKQQPVYSYEHRTVSGMPKRQTLVDPDLEKAVLRRFKASTHQFGVGKLKVKVDVQLDPADAQGEPLETAQLQREVSRHFSTSFRHGGASINSNQPNLLVEVLMSSRAVSVPRASGLTVDTILVPIVTAKALRAVDMELIGEASTKDYLGNDRTAFQVVRVCGADAVIKATALALMEDIFLEPTNQSAQFGGGPVSRKPPQEVAPEKTKPSVASSGDPATGKPQEVAPVSSEEGQLRVTVASLKARVEEILRANSGRM